jgi:hypothetical protein
MQHGRLDSPWGLIFGDGATAGPRTTLFYTASIGAEQYGLFGWVVIARKRRVGAAWRAPLSLVG